MNQLFLSTKSYRCCCFLIFAIAFMIGCSAGETSSGQEGSSEVIELVTMMPTPTELLRITTDALAPVSTIVDNSTAVPLPIMPSATPTVMLSATTTTVPVPTLTEIETETLFADLMATNGGCELPCWWNVDLSNNLESVSQIFTNRGMPWLVVGDSLKVDSDRMGTLDASYYDQYEGYVVPRLSVAMQFHELGGSIEYIYVFVNRVKFEESQQEFIRDWEQYFLSSFLQRYGKPTQVYFRLRTVADVMDPPQFSVSLLYREQGLAITYHVIGTWLHEEDARAEFCLDIKNVQALELSLFNPDGFDRWGYQFAPYHDELYEPLTWEAEMGVTLDTFYETYQDPENFNCITLTSVLTGYTLLR